MNWVLMFQRWACMGSYLYSSPSFQVRIIRLLTITRLQLPSQYIGALVRLPFDPDGKEYMGGQNYYLLRLQWLKQRIHRQGFAWCLDVHTIRSVVKMSRSRGYCTQVVYLTKEEQHFLYDKTDMLGNIASQFLQILFLIYFVLSILFKSKI